MKNIVNPRCLCELTHSAKAGFGLVSMLVPWRRDTPINNPHDFDDCVVLANDAFDPDAVFLDDIVSDDVLPELNLSVDGLTSSREHKSGDLVLRPEDIRADNDADATPVTDIAVAEPNQLEVYGWESNWWQKVRGYIGI